MSMGQEHHNRAVVFTVSRHPAVLNGHRLSEAEAFQLLASRGVDRARAEALVAAVDPGWYPWGAAVDLEFLSHQLEGRGIVDFGSPEFRQTCDLSRWKLQGTDGIRGRTKDEPVTYFRALEAFLVEGVIHPAFFGLTARALGQELLDQGLVSASVGVVVGADGRDPGGNFAAAVARGFLELGFTVDDAGVIPTPGVPLWAHRAGRQIGAIVTASHNPSNQNGIKYTFDGFKLLSDGPAGEFGLTARIFQVADDDGGLTTDRVAGDVGRQANDFLFETNLASAGLIPGDLAGFRLVYDGANGAYSSGALHLLTALGADFVAVNVDPRGHNINQDGGVGEIEGNSHFDGRVPEGVFQAYLSTVRTVFAEGRGSSKPVFGLVNDGDGDRGYLLAYDRQADRIHAVPGDEVAAWVALGRQAEGRLTPQSVFVNSVESDLNASVFAQTVLGMVSETACVGDKHLLIPAREGRDHVVGCEESGHVTFGVPVESPDGRPGTVYTGNGLLSLVYVLGVLARQKPTLEQIVHPFPEGAKDIRYVYFVDKARFFHGSAVWNRNRETALAVLEAGKPAGHTVRQVDFADDPQMLYLALFDPAGTKVGALFVRNSGTEVKTGVALRTLRAHHELFHRAMVAVHRQNQELMKDDSLVDAQREALVLETLGTGSAEKAALKTILETRRRETLSDTDFDALLYALRKQKLVTVLGTSVQRDAR